jgi:drug/metabolite transporter (DMT)-like permease
MSNLSALIVPLLAWWWFDERPTARFVAGAVAAMLGAGLLLMPPDASVLGTLPSGGSNYLLGNVLGIATAVFYALYQLSIKRARAIADTATVMALTATGSSLLLGGAAFATADRLTPVASLGWVPLFGMALVSQIAGQGLVAWSLGRVRASQAAVVLLLQPTVATVLGALVLDQSMSRTQWLALVPLLLGLYLAAGSRR